MSMQIRPSSSASQQELLLLLQLRLLHVLQLLVDEVGHDHDERAGGDHPGRVSGQPKLEKNY